MNGELSILDAVSWRAHMPGKKDWRQDRCAGCALSHKCNHFCSVPMYSAISFAVRREVNSVYFSFSCSWRNTSPHTGMLRVPCARTTRLPSIEDVTRLTG